MEWKKLPIKIVVSSSRNLKITRPLREFIVLIGSFGREIHLILLHNKRIIIFKEAFSVSQNLDFRFQGPRKCYEDTERTFRNSGNGNWKGKLYKYFINFLN